MTITLGGVTATIAEFAQTLHVLRDAPGNQMKCYLKDTPLAGMDYHKVSKEEIALFSAIRVVPGTKQNHVAQVRPACIHAMERVLGESGWHDPPVPPPELPVHGPGGGPGFDSNSARRTAKQNYGEDQAKMWAEKEFPGALVKKVGNCVPKPGYDVRVTLADGSEVHIEAKYSEGGSEVELSEGERKHNQGYDVRVTLADGSEVHIEAKYSEGGSEVELSEGDSGCNHEHVLYVVAGADATKVDGEWQCSGGHETPHRSWKIDTDDLKPRTWHYNVPS